MSTATDTSVEARLQLLEDKEAILDLYLAYGRYLDAKNWVPYSELFTETGQLVSKTGVGTATGPAEIRALFDKTLEGVPVGAFHIFSNIVIEVDGDRATGKTMWYYVTEGENGWPRILMFGYYNDIVVRVGDGWKFQLRDIDRVMGSPPYRR
jgi:hypothetical protein